ncbi:L-2-hydroxyglutarate oxidase [Amycolatopsis jiangsuensis]|uniref:L-2-hydroxyglutarate oxidase n=1 Tax=Amycolatopsis jiangsuensis TaxID=1181879 RepID=A0A840J3C4_9PSEU|nr:L-2-hydroxyglutarate oxidase [Amycolatopsis jiangsuensis]MBB4688219.1 L-2-hydroxyglutarate oxidase [Amycolatopsis jiangsuensis]
MYDFCVIGGGIVGAATALKLLERRPDASLLLLEKATQLGVHQTGHNSGVIHSGIYYEPGSLKAELCRRGAQATKEFAAANGIPFDVCGKLLVATNQVELRRLHDLAERAEVNQLEIEHLDAAELRRREPNIRGVAALLVPSTGIIDYGLVTAAIAKRIEAAGGRIRTSTEVDRIDENGDAVEIGAGEQRWPARRLVVCGGLQADRLARLAGIRTDTAIVPFRGEYYRLPAARKDLIRHLIYPVPDPDLPFLGVHLSPTVDGGITVGPNAVLGLAREGYRKFSVDKADLAELARFPGLWRLAKANIATGAREMKNSFFKRGYLAECRKYCPALQVADLLPQEAGIRAQAVRKDGSLVHDFELERTPRSVHVLNAPSPAATSALPIGELIAGEILSAH